MPGQGGKLVDLLLLAGDRPIADVLPKVDVLPLYAARKLVSACLSLRYGVAKGHSA